MDGHGREDVAGRESGRRFSSGAQNVEEWSGNGLNLTMDAAVSPGVTHKSLTGLILTTT